MSSPKVYSDIPNSSDKIYTGIVKWFNMDLRYGFITVLDNQKIFK